MKLSEFDYFLPQNLIAIKPVNTRDQSRLLVLDRRKGQTEDHYFFDIVDYLKPGDVLVLNNSRVYPARLLGVKDTGGKVEILLDKEIKPGIFEALGRGLKTGSKISFENSPLKAVVVGANNDVYTIEFNLKDEIFFDEVEKIGRIPLPPYIEKARDSKTKVDDKKRYQTVYAKKSGSVAAPTAGLHFTDDLLAKIREKGVEIVEITLHVGLGTFMPIKSEDIESHKIHSEKYSLDKVSYEKIIRAKKSKNKVIAVGTTSTRVLEHIFLSKNPKLQGYTDIYIYPGYQFKCVDMLVTNFHLPKSSLLLLVSALAGKENILNAYSQAILKGYRFYSYGDAMLIK